jgi:hypothetical protein
LEVGPIVSLAMNGVATVATTGDADLAAVEIRVLMVGRRARAA